MGADLPGREELQRRREPRIDHRDDRRGLAQPPLPGGQHRLLAGEAMGAERRERRRPVGERCAVGGQEHRRRQPREPVERGEEGLHLAVGRIDHHRPQAGDEIAADDRPGGEETEGEVPRRVPGGVQHFELERRLAGEAAALAVGELAVHLDPPGRQPRGGARVGAERHPERGAHRIGPGHVVGVVVGEPDLRHPPAESLAGGREEPEQAADLLLVAAAGIDQHRLPEAEQVGVGVGGRRQRRGAQRDRDRPRQELDPPQRPELPGAEIEQLRRGGFRTVRREHPQQVEDRRGDEALGALPAGDRRGGKDPLARLALRRQGCRLVILRPPGAEEEPVVEPAGAERRGQPAAGEAQPRRVEREPRAGEEGRDAPASRRERRPRHRPAALVRGEEQAGLLPELAQRAGGEAGRQVGRERLRIDAGFVRGALPGRHPGRLAVDRERGVGGIEAAAGEGVPAAEERQRPAPPEPVDLHLARRGPPPGDDCGRCAGRRGRRQHAFARGGEERFVERGLVHAVSDRRRTASHRPRRGAGGGSRGVAPGRWRTA